jgi:hypothetical protein
MRSRLRTEGRGRRPCPPGSAPETAMGSIEPRLLREHTGWLVKSFGIRLHDGCPEGEGSDECRSPAVAQWKGRSDYIKYRQSPISPTAVPPIMTTVPALPPIRAPPRTPTPPTIIIAVFCEFAPDSAARTNGRRAVVSGAIETAFVHDGALLNDGVWRTTVGDVADTNAADAASCDVSRAGEAPGLLCATSGVARSNTAIAVVRLRRCVT